jgi:hypothetical protein
MAAAVGGVAARRVALLAASYAALFCSCRPGVSRLRLRLAKSRGNAGGLPPLTVGGFDEASAQAPRVEAARP